MIRLIFTAIFFLISLLAICRAPEYHLWLLAIGVTEFPWLFAGITLILLGMGFWPGKYQLASTIINVVTLLLFISPIIRAYIVAGSLKQDMEAALEVKLKDGPDKPFSYAEMFGGVPKVEYKTLAYATYGDTSLTMDYYPAVPHQGDIFLSKPCVIVVHGGSWSSGDSQQLPDLNSYLAAKGYNVASINYRMAPKWQTPAPIEDIKNAIKYLDDESSSLHMDINGEYILLGRSAGGQIALLAAYTLHNPKILGVIDFYGVADMVWGYSIPSNPWIMDSRGVMDSYVGGSYAKVPQKFFDSSPLVYVDKHTVPTLIIHGDNDVLVSPEHSRRLDKKLQENGIKHFYLKLPWATHGFDYNLSGPGGQLSTYAVLQFLRTVSPRSPKGE